ncbi:LCP family protein [Streptomyces sp. TR02-1]|uniref:LCP family protein n=1 Tax=Streptomyces sp. TR02-1 TaxID=3385977 RepID=UPI0039A34F6D
MDTERRGRTNAAVDPADQWVFDPGTGSYVLRDEPTQPLPRPRRPSGNTRGREPGDREEPTAEPDGGGRRRRTQKRRGTARTVLVRGGLALGLLLAAGLTTGYLYLQHLNGNLSTVDLGRDAPATRTGKPMNILIIGTDSRQGEGNTGYGDRGSVGHADTNLVLHVAADRSHASAVSLPRDLITDIPDCPVEQADGTRRTIPGLQDVRFNKSLGQDGRDAGCTVKTAEQLTGLQIHHFLMADFNAVKDLSTAVGGVDVCVEHAVDDPDSHLRLPAGHSVVEGEQALAFVRTRHAFGNRSDLDRIAVQQQFLGSLIRGLKSDRTLRDPGKLLDLAEVATESLTVDTGIGSVEKLMRLAEDLRQVETGDITFVTAPVVDNPDQTGRFRYSVVLDGSKAEPLFRSLRSDSAPNGGHGKKSGKGAGNNSGKVGKQTGEVEPAAVRVDVLNGGSSTGAAQRTVAWLQNEQGVPRSTNAGNAPQETDSTVLAYAPDQAGQAATLAGLLQLPDTALRETGTRTGGKEPMTLTLGPDFTRPGEQLAAPGALADDVPQFRADEQRCAA